MDRFYTIPKNPADKNAHLDFITGFVNTYFRDREGPTEVMKVRETFELECNMYVGANYSDDVDGPFLRKVGGLQDQDDRNRTMWITMCAGLSSQLLQILTQAADPQEFAKDIMERVARAQPDDADMGDLYEWLRESAEKYPAVRERRLSWGTD